MYLGLSGLGVYHYWLVFLGIAIFVFGFLRRWFTWFPDQPVEVVLILPIISLLFLFGGRTLGCSTLLLVGLLIIFDSVKIQNLTLTCCTGKEFLITDYGTDRHIVIEVEVGLAGWISKVCRKPKDHTRPCFQPINVHSIILAAFTTALDKPFHASFLRVSHHDVYVFDKNRVIFANLI